MASARTRAVPAALLLAALLLAACGVDAKDAATGSDGDLGSTSRPSPSAIEASMAGTNLVSDLSADQRECYAQAIHDGDLSTELIQKVMADGDLDALELSTLDDALADAAAACGFGYVSGG